MERTTFDNWLAAYGRAWEEGDPQAIVPLFTESATYQETPFEAPMTGLAEIIAYWSDVPRSQEQIRFGYTILAVQGNLGIAHWQAAFTRLPSGERVRLDGILAAEFDAQGRCLSFREWWHRVEDER